MADVLVTGATGLLGSRVVTALAAEHTVLAIGRHAASTREDVQWISHDLRASALPDGLPSRVDVVIHLAQAREFREFPSRALDTFRVNVLSTALLADWAFAVGASHLMVASTGGVYRPSTKPHREEDVVGSQGTPSFYVASKLASEELARAYGSHMAVVVFRPFFMYGRGQDSRMLFPRLVGSIRSGKAIRLDGQDGMRFNPIHVDDAAQAVVAALALQQSCVVNLAGPEVLALRQAVDLLATALGIDPVVETRPAVSPTDVIGDISTMARLLGPPSTRLADKVHEVCAEAADAAMDSLPS